MVAERGKERMQMWSGCSPELVHPEAPSFRPRPAALPPEQTLRSPLSPSIPLSLSSPLVRFHSWDSPLDSTPKLGKAFFNICVFIILLACFVSASQDLSSSPSLERADSGLSEQSVSLLLDGLEPNCRERVNLGRETETEK